MANDRRSAGSEYGHREHSGSQLQDDVAEAGSSSQDGGVLIYIDNSYIWRESMKYSAEQLGFEDAIKQDKRIRVNIVKLLRLAAANKPIIRAVLYGSEPPEVQKFWNHVTRGSTYGNREREVDQSIMVDIGVDLGIHRNHAKHGGTIVIFASGGGMLNVVEKALEHDWNVELWACPSHPAHHYSDLAEKNAKFKIVYLNYYFREFVSSKFERSCRIPHERSCILTFKKIPVDMKYSMLELFVKEISQHVQMPVAARYLNVNDEDSSAANRNHTHLFIVCSVGKLILKEDTRSDNYLKQKAGPSSTPQRKGSRHHENANNEKSHNSFSFSPDEWNCVLDIMNPPELKQDRGTSTCVKTGFENVVDDAMRNLECIENNCCFSHDIYPKIKQLIENPATSQTTNQIATPSTSTKNVVVPTSTGNSIPSNSKKLNSAIKDYKPILRSLPQFIQHLKVCPVDRADFKRTRLEARGEHDDRERNNIVPTKKHRGDQHSKYCKYTFRCLKGFQCDYRHTAKEEEFFKRQSNGKGLASYKRSECHDYRNDTCKYKRETSHLCKYAHGYFCLTCRADEDGGHNIATCPNPPPLPQIIPD